MKITKLRKRGKEFTKRLFTIELVRYSDFSDHNTASVQSKTNGARDFWDFSFPILFYTQNLALGSLSSH